MKLSKVKIIMFFGVLLLLLWGLYPRGIFLGYIYEGMSELEKSEKYYLEYLNTNPYSKFAVMRLMSLYERMGAPRKAMPFLENLYAHRQGDDQLALDYLDFLERLHDDGALYKAQRQIADNLMRARRPAYARITEILDSAYDYAEWHHLVDDQYDILAKLVAVARDKDSYAWVMRHLDLNLKQTGAVVAALQQKLLISPNDLNAQEELIGLYVALKKYPEAAALLEEASAAHPDNADLLQLQISLDDRRKDMTAMIRNLQKLLGMHVLSEDEEWDAQATLAYAYQNNHQLNEALALYREFLTQDPLDSENWLNVVYVYESMGRWNDVVALLKEYLAQFPADGERQEMLVDIYLYRLKDLTQLPIYRQYVLRTHKAEFTLDVGNALISGHRPAEAVRWLEEMHRLFPRDAEMVDLLAQTCAATKNYAEAKSWYKLLAALKPNDMATQLTVGREIYFMDDPTAAEPYLKTVVAAEPGNVDAWFWLSEIHSQFSETAAMKEDARQVVALLTAQPPRNDTTTWMLLKSRGRVEKRPVVLLPDYAMAVALYPDNPDLLADEIDIMLAAKHVKEARQNIALFSERFPTETERMRMLDVRLAFCEKRWKDAIALLEPLVAENPHNWGLHRDLGEAYYHDMQWWRALPEIEKVQEATGDRYKVAELLRELHHDYDTRVTPTFNYTRYGSEYFWIPGVKFKDYLTHDWELNADARIGRFVSPSVGYMGVTEAGKVLVTSHHLRPWVFSVGIEGAHSPVRTTATPTVAFAYKPTPLTGITLTGTYRELRQDLPQAVAFGTLKDSVQLEGHTTLFDRLILSAKYTAERDLITSGATAKGQAVEPSASVIIFRKPYVTLGWQMDYQRLNSNGNFLASVPLIPYMNTQYVTGLISGRPIPTLLLEGGFYNGHDFDRGLSILGGDLWGVRGLFDWAVAPWLDFSGSYEFGRQRLLDIPGYSHVLNVALSAHW